MLRQIKGFILVVIIIGIIISCSSKALAWDCQQKYKNNMDQTAFDLTKILKGDINVKKAITSTDTGGAKFKDYEVTHPEGQCTVIHWSNGQVEPNDSTWACFNVHPHGKHITVLNAYWTDKNALFLGDAGPAVSTNGIIDDNGNLNFNMSNNWQRWEVSGYPLQIDEGPRDPMGPIYITQVYYTTTDVLRPLEELNETLFIDPNIEWHCLDGVVLNCGETTSYNIGQFTGDTVVLFQFIATGDGKSVTEIVQFQVSEILAGPEIVYVDAADGEVGNTTLATGEFFMAVDVGTGGSGADGLWRWRAFANSGTIFESGGDWAGDGNTEDCPRLVTLVEVPEGDYNVYAYFWADGDQWRIQASLTDSEGDLPLFIANDPGSEATVADGDDFAEPVPMLTEDNRTLWQVYLGTTGLTTAINVYIDDDPVHLNSAARTWYDGIGYEAVSAPEPTGPAWELKLDAEARLLISSFENPESEQFVSLYDFISFYYDEDEDQWLVNVFILLDDPENAQLLDEIGVERRTQVKDIVVARLPVESLPLLAQQPYVRFVETSTIQSLHMDASRPEIQADQVHQGINLPQPYEGEGVVVGVVDSGIDFTHADFSDSGGTRIQYLLEYTQGGGQNEWTKSQIDANPGSVTQRDADGAEGHGTHVTGTAAGGGKGNPIYRGIAPRADIIFVKGIRNASSSGGFDTADTTDACEYIFRKAQALGKPAVVNLSFGRHKGPHDGSSLYEQDLSNRTGPGKIIVASAGNAGWTNSYSAVHAGGAVVPNTTYGSVLLAAKDPTETKVNIWYDRGVISDVNVVAYKYIQNQFVKQASTGWYPVGWIIWPPLVRDSNGVVLGRVYIDAMTINDPRNGDGRIFLQIMNNGDPTVDIGQTAWLVAFKAQASGEVHMWPQLDGDAFLRGYSFSGVTSLPVDSSCTIGSPASAKKVISVGSYVTKNSWIDVDGTAHQWQGLLSENPLIGALSIFSSKGPTRDKRIAPDISAPGERIASALSSHLNEGIGYNRSYVVQGGDYRLMEGTSMSAPHVTGIVALMLEVNPNLDYDQVVNILQSTARSDGFTGTGLADNMFGAGKVDALAAVQATDAAKATPIHSYTFGDGTANDSIGSADGTLVGGAAVVNGALVTSAQDQWMEMPGNVIAMNTFNEVTIEAWYTPTAGANTGYTMLAYFGDSVNGLGSNGFFMTSAREDDKSRAAISIGNTSAPYNAESGADGPEYDDGILHHMVSTIDNTDITLYIDGVLCASTPLDPHNSISGISQNFAYLAKGGYDADPEWIGSIEEFNIYNKALSTGQVAANYAAGPQKAIPVDPGTGGLIAYYAMENSVNDCSGNVFNGTIYGDPNFVAGHDGMALDLDGNGDYVDCGYDPLFDVTTNEITVSAWVTIRSIANQWAAIAAKGEYAWRLGNASWDPRFHFGITIWSAPDTASLDGVTAVGYDEWHHAAGVFDGANIMVYLDGDLDVSAATTEPIGINNANMLIGDNPDSPGRYWDGLIDDLMIYNRALSKNEILYLAGN